MMSRRRRGDREGPASAWCVTDAHPPQPGDGGSADAHHRPAGARPRRFSGSGSGERMNIVPLWPRVAQARLTAGRGARGDPRSVGIGGSAGGFPRRVLQPRRRRPRPRAVRGADRRRSGWPLMDPRMFEAGAAGLADGWIPTNIEVEAYAEKLACGPGAAPSGRGREPGRDHALDAGLRPLRPRTEESVRSAVRSERLVRLLFFAAVGLSRAGDMGATRSSSPFEGGSGFPPVTFRPAGRRAPRPSASLPTSSPGGRRGLRP